MTRRRVCAATVPADVSPSVAGSLEPVYSPQASKMLDLVEADVERVDLWNAIVDALDLICDAPASAAARRDALRTPAGHTIWKVTVRYRGDDDDWVVLWQRRDDEALIAYIGPL